MGTFWELFHDFLQKVQDSGLPTKTPAPPPQNTPIFSVPLGKILRPIKTRFF